MKFFLVGFFCLAASILPASGRAASAVDFVSSSFSSPSEASHQIARMARELQENQDRRSLFPNIYALTISSAQRKLDQGEFRNPVWVKTLIVNYANLYRRTIYLELTGQRSRLPIAWQEEFAYAQTSRQWMREQDVINGINVHIARDLVEALLITPTNFDSESIRQDYFLITQSLYEAMPQIWNVFNSYGSSADLLKGFQQSLVTKWIADLRAVAWENAKSASRFDRDSKRAILDLLDQSIAKSSRHHGILLLVLPPQQPLRFR